MAEGESAHTYHRVFDPTGEDSLARIARRIAPGSAVLDVGCGPGVLSSYLASEKGCQVDAIDLDPAAVEAAASHCRTVRQANLDSVRPSDVFGERRYDAIVCADVLEHLHAPLLTLRDISRLLLPGGRLLVSLPHIAYAGVTGELLQGRFDYRPEGILDRTHLHFFTRRTLTEMLEGAGFDVLETEAVRVDLTKSEFDPCLDSLSEQVAHCLLSAPDALAYQFVAECGVRAAGAVRAKPAEPGRAEVPAKLRFYLQAYWRGGSEGFSDERRCWAPAEVGRENQTVRLVLPPLARDVAALRLDPADRPGYLRLASLRLSDERGNVVWRWTQVGADLSGCERHQLEIARDERGIAAICAGPDPWLVLPVPPAALGQLVQGGTLDVELSWPSSADYLVLAPKVRDLERERTLADAEIKELRAEAAALRERVEDALRLRGEAEAKAVRWLERATEAEAEAGRATGGLVELWRVAASPAIQSAQGVIASRAWRWGNALGNGLNRLKGVPAGDLTGELRAACERAAEAQRAVDELSQWRSRQLEAMQQLTAKLEQVVQSKRYAMGRRLCRVLAAVRPWRPWVDPAAPAEEARRLAAQGLFALAAGLAAPRAAANSQRKVPSRKRFAEPVDIVVAVGNGPGEADHLQKLIERTSPPYRLWLAPLAASRAEPWLVEFATAQGALIVSRDGNGPSQALLDSLRRSPAPAVVFVDAAETVSEGWLDEVLAMARDAEVPLDKRGASRPENGAEPPAPREWPRRVLTRKEDIDSLAGTAP